MISDLRPYPEMKRSGVPWLGAVPAHWGVRRLRNAAEMRVSNVDKHAKVDEEPVRLCNYVDVYKHDRIDLRLPFMRATATREEVERFRLRVGDVLITKDSESWEDIGVPALVAQEADDLISGYHLALLRPMAGVVSGPFLFRALQSEGLVCQMRVEARGVTRFGLTHAGIKSTCLPVPPLDEQAAIVRYLDHVDRRVRRLVRAKRKLIALLTEQKQAIIHRAVTRGLDPDVPLKDSGVEWLGEVPEHWLPGRLKDVATVQTGVTMGKGYGSTALESRPYLRVANVQVGRLDLREVKRVSVPAAEAAGATLRDGDVLMTEGGDIDKLGRGCVWRDEIPGCLHQNHVFAVRCLSGVLEPEFLVGLMASQHGRIYFQTTAKQTTNLASTNSTTLRAFPVVLPPIAEQRQILAAIGRKSNLIDRALSDAQREIRLVDEYRQRLVADVVTGKRDVRDAAANLPDEPVEDEGYEETDALGVLDDAPADAPDAVAMEEEA